MQKSKYNSLLIYKTQKGYYFNSKTGTRESEKAYKLQFAGGKRNTNEAIKKGLEILKDEPKNYEQIKNFVSNLSEQKRERKKIFQELKEESRQRNFYWNLDDGNKNFKNGKVKIITPKGGVISTEIHGRQAVAEAYTDLKSGLNKISEKARNSKNQYLFTIETYFENDVQIIDFTTISATDDLENLEQISEENEIFNFYADFIAEWESRK